METGKVKLTSAYCRLFLGYADRIDLLLMVLGTLGSLVSGLSLPAMYLIQSHLFNKMGSGSDTGQQATVCVYIALVASAGAYLEASSWILTGNRQAQRLRILHASTLLRLDSAYFDCDSSPAEVISNVSTDIAQIQDAVGEKLGKLLEYIVLFVGSLAAGLVLTWKMTLLMLPFTLLLLLPGFFYSKTLSSQTSATKKSYSEAGKVAEQALSAIRVVYSFTAESRTLQRYSKSLDASVRVDRMQGLCKGLALGLHGLRYGVWSLMIWVGGNLVLRKEANGAQVLIAGSAFIAASTTLGNVIENLKEVTEGHAALVRIYQVLDSRPSIDINSIGKKLDVVQGELDFINVSFAYPSRPRELVLRNFNLHIPRNKTTALVGSSGSGKSTVIALLERFYNPSVGGVLFDQQNIKTLDLTWFRQQIGLVSQEPALFSLSVKDNIMLGKETASLDEVTAAAKKADAHSFIMQLPQGYDTDVGMGGTKLSGGQKQRIAIARAVIKNPAILLLDEATSALDNESERTVQKAIHKVLGGRTTVIVAHKLQSIEKADLIAVLRKGEVVEIGPPTELLNKKADGAYFQMFHLQSTKEDQNQLAKGTRYPEEESKPSSELLAQELSTASAVKSNKSLFSRLRVLMSRSNWKHYALGTIGALCVGTLHPVFVIIGANAVSSFYTTDERQIRQSIRTSAAVFAVLAVLTLTINTLQHYSFGALGAELTRRIREQMLGRILKFDVSWFDQEGNSSGAICSRLETNATMIKRLIGDRISLLVQMGSTICTSIILSFVISWPLAIVVVSIQPLIMLCFYTRVNSLGFFAKSTAKVQEQISELVLEATTHHRTVSAMCSQPRVLSMLEARLKTLSKKALVLSQTTGLTSGSVLFVLFASYGLCIWHGANLIADGKCSFREFLLIFYLLIGTGRSLADALALSPDISQGMAVATSIFDILDKKTSEESLTPETADDQMQGRIVFDKVFFAYPTRPSIRVLKNFSLEVKPSKTTALVGRSGSGKSTVIALIERFYEPQSGRISMDGKDIKNSRLEAFRQQLGLVSQEPTLFALSIRDNIGYGNENATDMEIMEAAKAANAHEFISGLPDGYKTFLGGTNVQLSGGQKQRIAIARAILKRPKVLLLDEATSALDKESETIVKEALDKNMAGRTVLVIAHRLTTIKNAAIIAVVQEGAVAEQGTYSELLAEGGAFALLASSS